MSIKKVLQIDSMDKFTNLFDSHRFAHEVGSVEGGDGSFSFLCSLHGHEAESAGIPRMGIIHDGGLLDLKIHTFVIAGQYCEVPWAYSTYFCERCLKVAGIHLVAETRDVEIVSRVSPPIDATTW